MPQPGAGSWYSGENKGAQDKCWWSWGAITVSNIEQEAVGH